MMILCPPVCLCDSIYPVCGPDPAPEPSTNIPRVEQGGEGAALKGEQGEKEGLVIGKIIGVCSHQWPASHSPPSAARSLGWRPAPCRSCWPLSPPGGRGRGEKRCETRAEWCSVIYTVRVYVLVTFQINIWRWTNNYILYICIYCIFVLRLYICIHLHLHNTCIYICSRYYSYWFLYSSTLHPRFLRFIVKQQSEWNFIVSFPEKWYTRINILYITSITYFSRTSAYTF